jgi:hypothetical protein
VRQPGRRRVSPLLLALVAVAALMAATVLAAQRSPRPLEGVVFAADPPPKDWAEVTVGRATISVPPGWAVLDERAMDPDELRACPDVDGPTVWVRLHPNAGLWFDCDPAVLDDAVHVAALGRHVEPPTPTSPGEPDRIGALAAWRSDPVPPDRLQLQSRPAEEWPPLTTTWVAPAADLWAAVPETLDAADLLATVRPTGRADPDAAVLLLDYRGISDAETLRYAIVDARGRRAVWYAEPQPQELLAGMAGARGDWPALTSRRFAVLDVAVPGSVRIVAGRPDRAHVAWEEVDAFGGMTLGSHPQLAWLPDGSGILWYAPREDPLLGVVRWEDADALADGESPIQDEVVAAEGPVQVDPDTLSVTAEGRTLRLHFFRGTPTPYDPHLPWEEQVSHPWELVLERTADGRVVLPDRVVLAEAH